MPKTICWIVLVVSLPQLVGCSTYRRHPSRILSEEYEGAVGDRVRVTAATGERTVIRQAWMDNGMLLGITKSGSGGRVSVDGRFTQANGRVAIPLDEVQKLEYAEFSFPKTALLTVGLGVGPLIAAAAVARPFTFGGPARS